MTLEDAVKLTNASRSYILDKSEMPENKFFPFDPQTWHDHTLLWDGPIGFANGYGKVSMAFMESLADICDLRILSNNWGESEKYLSDKVRKIAKKPVDKLDAFHVQLYPVHMFNPRLSERQLGYSMHETTRIPFKWVQTLNNDCERVLVPSNYQKDAFLNSGVKRDVFVLPCGLDLRFLPEKPQRKPDGIWRFGIMGGLTARKGVDVLVKAFKIAFPKQKDVDLFIKTQPKIGANWLKEALLDDRIGINNQNFTPEELVTAFFDKIDCFVFPTRGEGFGLPPLEAMAMGKPTICTNYSGCVDYLSDKVALPLNFKEVLAPLSEFDGYPEELRAPGQMWAEPDLDQLVYYLRWTYEHQDEARKLGQKASKYARVNWNNLKMANKLLKYLDNKF